MFTPLEMTTRQKKFMKTLANKCIAFVFSGVSKLQSDNAQYDFSVNPNFYYLTGLDLENSILVFIKHNNTRSEVLLFTPPPSIEKARWLGAMLTSDDIIKQSGITNINDRVSFEDFFVSFLKTNSEFSVAFDFHEELKVAKALSLKNYIEENLLVNNKAKYLDVRNNIVALRMIKSDDEVAAIKMALGVTSVAITEARRALKTAKYEHEVLAAYLKSTISQGVLKEGFPPIIAAGKNATILHYPKPLDALNHNDLILFDVGASYLHYSADVSRTYPISGKYSLLQKKIYKCVLECNKYIISLIKPGVSLVDLQNEASTFLKAKSVAAGLLKEKDEIKNVYPHNISHHLGLETHDATLGERNAPLVSGNVITVEPGLYFDALGIGVRIEDVVLVTNNGAEVLSKDIPKEILGIEFFKV
ncbi:MAG: Xaa-Pro peptidase family protein [Erysipelotrichaceae bacterium]|jgi:Xaa-Pro aminopeptidase|nr:Xaa-Pro peptidase family protein [Erysipelotrichaceae bacterium]